MGSRQTCGAGGVSIGADQPGRLAVLVHEVRSPVAALRAIAEAARRDDFDSTAVREVVPLAVAACLGIRRIVTDATVASVHLEEVDVESLVRAAAAAASLSGARVRAEVRPGLPSVAADPLRLRQALDNLIANALVHGSPDEEVVVSAAVDGTCVLLAVADRGEGIPREQQSRIFEAGARLDEDRPGAGMGLAITRAIVEAHGATITVHSATGRGTTFTITIPLPR